MLVDTNVLIRHLTGDPPDQARRATRRLVEEPVLVLTDVVLAECAFVLMRVYGLTHPVVAEKLRSLLALRSLVTADRETLVLAVRHLRERRISFVDAYLAALAERSGVRSVLSFDRDFDRLPVERIAP